MQDELGAIQDILKESDFVHAAWIEGSIAEGFNDDLSDIDLWIDVDDDKEDAAFGVIEEYLKSKAPLEINFEVELAHPQIRHKVYRLKSAADFDILEVNIQSHSRNFVFTEGVESIKVLFDKDGTIQTKPLDQDKLEKNLSEREEYLTAKIPLGKLWIRKETARNNFPDALHNYNFWILEPVVELARIKYSPRKISFGLKHLSRDLPPEVARRIEDLHGAKSLQEINEKLPEAEALIKSLGY